MRKLLFIGIASMACLCACQPAKTQSDAYTVSGELEDSLSDGKMIYLVRYDDRRVIDSTRVEANKFVFSGKVDTAAMCRIDVTRQAFANLILESGDIKVNLKKYNYPSGTPLNEEMARIAAREDSFLNAMMERHKTMREQYTDKNELDKQRKEFLRTQLEMSEQFCKEVFAKHANDAVGFFMTYTYFMRMLEPEVQEELLNATGPLLKQTQMVQHILTRIANQKNTAEGKPFVDIQGKDADGKETALSDFIGKGDYVLIDMWASWCGPCQQEIPNIAQLHNKYKDKGLSVIGIFVWDREENLQKTLEKENITWPQIIDTEAKACDLYGVDGIPHIILFAPDGTILYRDLRGEEMIRKVSKLLENK